MYDLWRTGKRQKILRSEIVNIIKEVVKNKNHKIIIGSDSVKIGEGFVFTNAICILNANSVYDRRYFYNRRIVKDNSYYELSKRLLKETVGSIDIALELKEKIININIEIHADVNHDIKYKSAKYKNMIIGYVNGCGFLCKVKPESFVASGIADNHTRKC